MTSGLSRLIITHRLRLLSRTWHPSLRKALEEYIHSRLPPEQRWKTDEAHVEPHWLAIPALLAHDSRMLSKKDLLDILWAQYCILHFVKIHDDLFDAQTNKTVLLFAADRLMFEGQRILAIPFRSSSTFWKSFYWFLNQSLNGIVAADDVQCRGRVSLAGIASLYADEYSVCKIGLLAVCQKTRTMALFPRLSAMFDDIAIIGQILDDLADIEKDLQRGRLNYAAVVLSGKRDIHHSSAKSILKKTGANFFLEGTGETFFRLLRRRLNSAMKIGGSLNIANISRYLRSYEKSIEALESELHHRRLAALFGKSIPSPHRSARP